MPTAGAARTKNRRPDPPAQMTWDWFDREMADIQATLARLEASVAAKPAAPVAPAPMPKGLARAAQKPADAADRATDAGVADSTKSTSAPALAVPAKPPAAQPVAAPTPLPAGTDLADPKNFGLMPPTANLEQGALSAEDYRKRIVRDLTFATKVLHTSRVPAAVWREWRVFEKAAQERLRAMTVQPAPAD